MQANTLKFNTVQRSYKFRVYPNTSQIDLLSQCFGIARFTYNTALDAISFGYKTQGQKFTWIDCSKALTELSRDPDYEFLKIAPRTAIDQALQNLDKAFKHFLQVVQNTLSSRRNNTPKVSHFSLINASIIGCQGRCLSYLNSVA